MLRELAMVALAITTSTALTCSVAFVINTIRTAAAARRTAMIRRETLRSSREFHDHVLRGLRAFEFQSIETDADHGCAANEHVAHVVN